jgi:hypothetical protein
MLENAVTQIKDVAGPAVRPVQYVMHASFELGQRGKEGGRVQVTLDGYFLSKHGPAIVQRDAPVEPDHVAAGALHQRQECGSIRPKMDDGHTCIFRRRQNFL